MSDNQQEEIEAKKAELRGKIRTLRGKIEILVGYKKELIDLKGNTDGSVKNPVDKYDLTVSTDITHWNGNLETNGENKRSDLSSGINGFITGIDDVINNIDIAIEKLEKEISELESELAAL